MSSNISSPESGSSAVAMSHEILQRLASQSANCKLWSVLTISGVFILALNGGGLTLLSGAIPVVLLALADAGYAAQSRRIAEWARRVANSKDPLKVGEIMQVQASGWGLQGALTGLMGFLSFTVWPFYLVLAGAVVGLGSTSLISSTKPGPYPTFRPSPLATTSPGQARPSPSFSGTLPQQPTRTAPNIAKPPFPPPGTAVTGANRPRPSVQLLPPGVNVTAPSAPDDAPPAVSPASGVPGAPQSAALPAPAVPQPNSTPSAVPAPPPAPPQATSQSAKPN